MARVYDTILSIPGMNETVKIDCKISRKNVLLLSNAIERGIALKDDKTATLLDTVPAEVLNELKLFAGECLHKAGLTELNEKLLALNEAKKGG